MSFEDEARDEILRGKLIRDWIRTRIDNIHASISAYDMLQHHHHDIPSADREYQIRCPFHGEDNKPSARAYPETSSSKSHIWCYYCRKSWDVIGLWKEFHGQSGSFSQMLLAIEKDFGLKTPPMPKLPEIIPVDPALERYQQLIVACENRLLAEKSAFDMRTYLTLCTLLDRIHVGMKSDKLTATQACKRCQKILDKIGEKVRAQTANARHH